ncbi:hypothetical protein FPSE_08968 [Fusarium pseudograminearum CS3096]|uniref:Uncharacterized protein n=1 Tax=Fusarium pseudograminearum (strain CS3096) TaxID=1028729 RepID=K3UGB2_FUSPC|nr:hypothetical protein FPSE_08968 [Fusarium pseudograminearum CS3096]EKJ70816.1 hypothetical protein FPSE_08968 [Fusarium pseudograminearum CS3096]
MSTCNVSDPLYQYGGQKVQSHASYNAESVQPLALRVCMRYVTAAVFLEDHVNI